jgi:hemin uptake protein HemP
MSGDRSEAQKTAGAQPLPRLDVREVMKDSREVILVHRGQDYRLRITSNDKLILTK